MSTYMSKTQQIDARLIDCDNHYYEAEDAFTRHVPKAMHSRCVEWAEVEGRKRIRAYVSRDMDGNTVFGTIQRVSKPGCRVYKNSRDVEKVLRGMGIGIYSTSKGVLTDNDCREQRLGGEYLGRIW